MCRGMCGCATFSQQRVRLLIFCKKGLDLNGVLVWFIWTCGGNIFRSQIYEWGIEYLIKIMGILLWGPPYTPLHIPPPPYTPPHIPPPPLHIPPSIYPPSIYPPPPAPPPYTPPSIYPPSIYPPSIYPPPPPISFSPYETCQYMHHKDRTWYGATWRGTYSPGHMSPWDRVRNKPLMLMPRGLMNVSGYCMRGYWLISCIHTLCIYGGRLHSRSWRTSHNSLDLGMFLIRRHGNGAVLCHLCAH